MKIIVMCRRAIFIYTMPNGTNKPAVSQKKKPEMIRVTLCLF